MNLVGSFCETFQFCNKCSCTCSNASFAPSCCTQLVIVGQPVAEMGDVALPEDLDLQALVEKVDQNRSGIPDLVVLSSIAQKKFNKQSKNARDKQVMLAIYKLASAFIETLQKDGCFSVKEAFARLRLVQHLAGVDLVEKFASKTPICTVEKQGLEKELVVVDKFGCYAALFWTMTQGEHSEVEKDLRPKFSKQLVPYQERLKAKSFAGLGLDVQAALLGTAKSCARYLPSRLLNPHSPWLESASVSLADDPLETDEKNSATVSTKKTDTFAEVDDLMDTARSNNQEECS